METARLPLDAFERFRTADLDEARHRVEALLSVHGLHAARPGARLDVRYCAVDLGDTSIIRAQYGAEVQLDPGVLEDFYLVGMPLSGSSVVHCDGQALLTRPGLASVQSCQRSVRTEWRDDCCKLSVKIGRRALEQRLCALLGRPPSRPLVFDLALDLERGAGASWRRLMEFLMNELAPGSMYLASAAPRRTLEETVIVTLLMAQRHNYTDEVCREAPPAAPRYVRQAEGIIAADPSMSHALTDLAAQTGVSVRSLQAGFRRYRGMTLVEFVRAQRLERARKALLQAAAGTRVTHVALECGYGHIGRFAQDYKARYGESPSHTLASANRKGDLGH